MNKTNEMFETVNAIRSELFPEIPEGLLKEIIKLEEEYQGDRVGVIKKIEQVVERHLKGEL